jgi:catechol 2,3-dioxygenase-like lactoylglutathione lyase family enzyme
VAAHHPPGDPPRLEGILETCLYVDDLERAEEFYGSVLGLRAFARAEGRHVFFRCGSALFLLFNPAASGKPAGEVPPHGARGPGHAAFRVSEQRLDRWRRHLLDRGVEIEAEVSWPAGGRSLYFRDPAGNCLELATAAIWGLEEEG